MLQRLACVVVVLIVGWGLVPSAEGACPIAASSTTVTGPGGTTVTGPGGTTVVVSGSIGTCTVSIAGTNTDRGTAFAAALSTAVCGDVIVLQAGYTFSADSGFEIPRKTAPSCAGSSEANYITIRSSGHTSIPTSIHGKQLPTYAAHMATITCGHASQNCTIIQDAAGGTRDVGGWKFIGIEFTTHDNTVVANNAVQLGAYAGWEGAQASEGWIFDRVFIHPQEASAADLTMETLGSLRTGIQADVKNVTVTRSYITVGWPKQPPDNASTDGIGVACNGSCDGLTVTDSYINSSFNPIFLGGADAPAIASRTKVIQASPSPTTSAVTLDSVGDLQIGDYIALKIRSERADQVCGSNDVQWSDWGIGEVTGIAGTAVSYTRLAQGSWSNAVGTTALVNNGGGYATTTTSIAVDGVSYPGVLPNYKAGPGSSVKFSGHATCYTLASGVTFSGGTATLTLSSGLTATVADNETITFYPLSSIVTQDFDTAPIAGGAAQWRGQILQNVTFQRNYIECWPELNDALVAAVPSGICKAFNEIKAGYNLLQEGNYFVSHPQRSGDIPHYTQNQNGSSPWIFIGTSTIRYNWFRNARGFSYPNASSYGVQVPDLSTGFTAQHNMLEGVLRANDAGGTGTAIIHRAGGILNALVDHNTIYVSDQPQKAFRADPTPNEADLAFTNNIFPTGQYGPECIDTTEYAAACYGTGKVVIVGGYNGVVDNRDSGEWGTPLAYATGNNVTLHVMTGVGFTSTAQRDYRLTALSPYHNAASDGTDIGADFADIYAAMGAALWAQIGLSWTP